MPIIAAHGLTKSYGTRVVLSAVDLTIRTGERVGVVGENGSGKSTLARILAGSRRGGRSHKRDAQSGVLEGQCGSESGRAGTGDGGVHCS